MIMPVYVSSEGTTSQVPTHLTRISIPCVTISTDCTNKIIKGKVIFKGPLSKTASGSFLLKAVIQEDGLSKNSSINIFLFGMLAKDFSHSVSLEDVVVASGFTVGKSPTAKSDNRHPFNLLLTSDQACIYVTPPDPGPSSASKRNSSLSSEAPKPAKVSKYTYVKLSDLKEGDIVNIYGVVVFFKQPFKTHGTDYCSSLKITDQSNQKIVCTIFCRELDDHPKIFQIGDIIRMHRVKVKLFKDSMTLVNTFGFSFVMFDGTVGSAVEPQASSRSFYFDDHDRQKVEELRSWFISQGSSVSAAVPLSAVQPKVYFDLTCQLLAKAPINTTCMLLRVWDGTKCPYPQSDVTIDPDTIEGPASFSGTKESFIANILVFDNHAVSARELKVGAFLRIYNLRAVFESVQVSGHLRVNTDRLVFQLNRGTLYGKGIRVLPENSPDVQKLKRFVESFSEDVKDEPSDSEMLEVWSTPPEFLNGDAAESCTERSCRHQIQPMTLSQLKQSQPNGEYHVRAQLRSYQPHRLHQSLKLFCSNCSSLQEIPNEEVLSGIFSAAFQDSTTYRCPQWILSGHVSLPEDVAQSLKKPMDVLISTQLMKEDKPKEFIFLRGFCLEETCMLAAHYENIVPLTSSGGDLDLLDLSAPFLFRGKKRYYGCKRCSKASLSKMKGVGVEVIDDKFLAEDLGVQLLQYVLLMRLKLQDSTDTLDVLLWKDAEKFFGVSAEDVSASEEAQERIHKIMEVLCPPEDSQDQHPWLDLCLTAYPVEDEPGQSQTCYQITNTTIITPSTTQSDPD